MLHENSSWEAVFEGKLNSEEISEHVDEFEAVLVDLYLVFSSLKHVGEVAQLYNLCEVVRKKLLL